MIRLILLDVRILGILHVSILWLALSRGDIVVLVDEDHLLVLMFTFQN